MMQSIEKVGLENIPDSIAHGELSEAQPPCSEEGKMISMCSSFELLSNTK
jgi:hypothetical protein